LQQSKPSAKGKGVELKDHDLSTEEATIVVNEFGQWLIGKIECQTSNEVRICGDLYLCFKHVFYMLQYFTRIWEYFGKI
jgi:hypothetical protein